MTAVRITVDEMADESRAVVVELMGELGAVVGRGFVSLSQLEAVCSGVYGAVQVPLTADGLPGDPSPVGYGPLKPEPLEDRLAAAPAWQDPEDEDD